MLIHIFDQCVTLPLLLLTKSPCTMNIRKMAKGTGKKDWDFREDPCQGDGGKGVQEQCLL